MTNFTAFLTEYLSSKYTSHGFYQTQFIIKRLEQFFWVEKTLKIIEQNITAKYFRYLNLPFLGHDSKTLILAKKVKKG